MSHIDWMGASRDAYCLGGSLSSPRASERGSVDTIVTYKWYMGLNQRPSRDWTAHKKLIKWWYIVRSNGNNDDSVILFGRHVGILSLGPIYQRGVLKITLLYNYIIPKGRNIDVGLHVNEISITSFPLWILATQFLHKVLPFDYRCNLYSRKTKITPGACLKEGYLQSFVFKYENVDMKRLLIN